MSNTRDDEARERLSVIECFLLWWVGIVTLVLGWIGLHLLHESSRITGLKTTLESKEIWVIREKQKQ